jgi:hypothetical protein
MGDVVEASEEHPEIGKAESRGELAAVGQLGGIAVTTLEVAQILGADRFEALGVDLLDARESELRRHEQLAPSKGKENGVFTRALRGGVMGDEGQGKSAVVTHAVEANRIR